MNCPYCQSEISDRAIKCAYCHSMIIERRISFFEKIRKRLSLFLTISSAILLSLLLFSFFIYKYYYLYEVKYDHSASRECNINVEYLNNALSLYEEIKGERIHELDQDSYRRLKKFIGESDFIIPDCPLGGEYYIKSKNSVSCKLHKNGKN